MKIFVSGKITGEPIWDCLHKFAEVESVYFFGNDPQLLPLNYANFIVPLDLDGIHFGISHDEAMKICLAELETCDGIYMLKDWKESKGAQMEHDRAKELGIEIFYER